MDGTMVARWCGGSKWLVWSIAARNREGKDAVPCYRQAPNVGPSAPVTAARGAAVCHNARAHIAQISVIRNDRLRRHNCVRIEV